MENLESQILVLKKASKSSDQILDGDLEKEKKDFRLIQLLQVSDFRLGNELINIKRKKNFFNIKNFYFRLYRISFG